MPIRCWLWLYCTGKAQVHKPETLLGQGSGPGELLHQGGAGYDEFVSTAAPEEHCSELWDHDVYG